MRRAPLPDLAGPRLHARRLALGLSESGLSRSLGVSPMTVRRIEEGCDPLAYDLRFLASYAGALGIDFVDLFDWETLAGPKVGGSGPGDVEVDDVEAAGAVLAGSGGRARIDSLAEALEWPIERVRLALDGLGDAVTAAGMRLVWFADTEVLLSPNGQMADVVAAQVNSAVAVDGLNVAEFEIVAQLARSGPVTHRSRSNVDVLGRLVSAGVVQVERTGMPGKRGRQHTEVALTEDARFDLCLKT